MSLKLKAIHKGVQFDQSPWLAAFIDFNTDMRKKSKEDFEKDFFKLINNSSFGKFCESVLDRCNATFIFDKEKFEKICGKNTFKRFQIINEHTVIVEQYKTKVKLNKCPGIGGSILDLSKLLMYNYWYDLKDQYKDRLSLLQVDTDGLIFEVRTQDFYKEQILAKPEIYDRSVYKKNKKLNFLYDPKNEKVVGTMKDECADHPIIEYCGIKSKQYAKRTDDDEVEKRCKGVKKNVVKRDTKFGDYKRAIFPNCDSDERQINEMHAIRSMKQNIGTFQINKVGICAFDNKKFWVNNVEGLSHGHYKIKEIVMKESCDTMNLIEIF